MQYEGTKKFHCKEHRGCKKNKRQFTTTGPERLSRNQSSKCHFTIEGRSSQSSQYFIMKDSFLGVLRASAVQMS